MSKTTDIIVKLEEKIRKLTLDLATSKYVLKRLKALAKDEAKRKPTGIGKRPAAQPAKPEC